MRSCHPRMFSRAALVVTAASSAFFCIALVAAAAPTLLRGGVLEEDTAMQQQSLDGLDRFYRDVEQHLKHREQELKGHDRRLKDLQRGLGTDHPSLANLASLIDRFRGIVTAARSTFSSISMSNADAGDVLQDVQDQLSELTDVGGEFNDVAGDLEDVARNTEDREDALQRLKDVRRSVKNQERDLLRLRKKFDVGTLRSLLDARNVRVTEMQKMTEETDFDGETFWSVNDDDNDAEMEIEDGLSLLRDQENAARQVKEVQRMLKDKTRTQKDMVHQCGRKLCNGTHLGELRDAFIEATKEMQRHATAGDYESAWESNGEADDVATEFWEEIEDIRDAENLNRDVKNLEREMKNGKRIIKDAQRAEKRGEIAADTAKAIAGLFADLESATKEARTALTAKDYDGARDAVERADDIRADLEDALGPLREQEDGISESGLRDILRQIADAEEQIDAAFDGGSADATKAKQCRDLLTEGRGTVRVLLEGKKSSEERQVLGEHLEELGDTIDAQCGAFFDD